MIIKQEFESKFKHLENAINSLKKAIIFSQKYQDFEDFSIIRDSNIQRFEYSFEISWKFMKYILEKFDSEIETRSPRQVLKTAFRIWYIDNLNKWFEMIEYRNKTSHEYEEDIADDLFEKIPYFFEEIQRFYELIKIKYHEWYFETN